MIAVSAPGKVLLAGGYLVVDRAYKGLVFGLDARIHVVVQVDRNATPGSVTVRSPQFRDAIWEYQCVDQAGCGTEVKQTESADAGGTSRNKFVETALSFALSYLSAHEVHELQPTKITILADTDYYSHSQTAKPCAKNLQSRFKDFNVRLNDAHKTGLGSSAALVTALVSAVVLYGLKVTNIDDTLRRRLHNLAQTAHCVAQGKIGSGFDVAAAVYGACTYRRFSPSVLDQIGVLGTAGFESRLATSIDDAEQQLWDMEIDASAVNLPKGLRLVLCDVDCGSETPSMVKKVMNWRKESPEDSQTLWSKLSQANMDLAAELQKLYQALDPEWTSLSERLLTIRSLIREMSIKADVPIEPPIQTHLLDGCSAIEGVIGGVVPGAGGYDALSLIIEDREEVVDRLNEFLHQYQSPTDLTGDTKIGTVRLLDVKQEIVGVTIETPDYYDGWL